MANLGRLSTWTLMVPPKLHGAVSGAGVSSARCSATFLAGRGGGGGERCASPPILCHHQMLLVVVMWLVAGWEPAAEPGPGPEESLLATVAAVASLPWPQSRREKLRVTCFLYSSSYSPSFYLREGRKLLWGSTDPLPHSLTLPSVPGCNPTASACLSVLTSRLFWDLFSTQTCGT